MARLHPPRSPGLVVACIALVVALGGTSYAAIVLPADSVGTRQLRNAAVTGAKVRPHSLLRSHFAAGQLQDGAAGLPGPAGPAATKLFATVVSDGAGGISTGPSSGLVGKATKLGSSGLYTLTFNQDVSGCAVIAMPGGKALTEGQVTAQTTGGAGVTVQTFDSGGSSQPLDSFTVAALC